MPGDVPDWFALFAELLDDFDRLHAMARNLHSPNVTDHLYARHAIVGFSHCSATEAWGRNHLEFVNTRLSAGYPDLDVERIAPEPGFYCVGLG